MAPRIAVLIFSACLLAGCSSYSAPGLKIASARIAEETGSGLVLDFAIDATNRNEIELPLYEVRYTLRLDGREVFSGVRSPEASLRRFGTQTIHIPAVVAVSPGSPRPTGPRAYSLDGTLGYITPGQVARVLFDIKVRRPRVGFHEEGSIDLGQAPEPKPQARLTPAPAGSGPTGSPPP
jgi:Late embryogenesis abundant protein